MYTASSNYGRNEGPRLGGGGRRRRGRRGNIGLLAVSMVVILGAGWGGCALEPGIGEALSSADADGADTSATRRPSRQVASLEPQVASLEPMVTDPSLDPAAIEPAAGADQTILSDQTAALPEQPAIDPSATVSPSQNYRIDPLVPEPVIEDVKRRIDSVAYARERSGIKLFGQPWRWWTEARGRYHRGQIPSVGAVMVFKRAGRSSGHLAVVTHRVGYRDIIVDHANWRPRQPGARAARAAQVFHNTRVRDVSPANDWTQVQVWPAPDTEYGAEIYATAGFVYPVAMTEILDIHALYKNDRSLLVGVAPAAN
jgi:hypothetical protein